MNRFTAYLDSMKLAKMMLLQAEWQLDKGDVKHAVRDALKSQREFMTSINNLASLLFERRKKR